MNSIGIINVALCALVAFFNVSFAFSSTGNRTLVVIDAKFNLDDYSQYFNSLKESGYELDFKYPTDEFEIVQFNQKLNYNHLILTPIQAKPSDTRHLAAKKLEQFTNLGGNIILIVSENSIFEPFREYSHQIGIEISPRKYKTIDHFNYDILSSPESHDTLVLGSENLKNIFVSDEPNGNNAVLFKGVTAALSNSQLLVPILQASKYSYTIPSQDVDSTSDLEPWVAGLQSYPVAGFQARNNARFLFMGSLAMISNDFFEKKFKSAAKPDVENNSSNKGFTHQASLWTFQENGVIKVNYVKHYRDDQNSTEITDSLNYVELQDSNGPIYRVSENVTYSISLSKWNGLKGDWVPYIVPENDKVQVEFRMLDPYYRLNLSPSLITESDLLYQVSFKIPDQHGVFTFYTNYKRSGLSFIEQKDLVTIRHLAHNEYTRSYSINSALVYVSSSVSIIIFFIVFVLLWIYSDISEKKSYKVKVQ